MPAAPLLSLPARVGHLSQGLHGGAWPQGSLESPGEGLSAGDLQRSGDIAGAWGILGLCSHGWDAAGCPCSCARVLLIGLSGAALEEGACNKLQFG